MNRIKIRAFKRFCAVTGVLQLQSSGQITMEMKQRSSLRSHILRRVSRTREFRISGRGGFVYPPPRSSEPPDDPKRTKEKRPSDLRQIAGTGYSP